MLYMKKLIKRGKKRRKGFTLVELLAVILVLGIIAMIAIPSINNVIEESRKGAKEQSGSNLVSSTNEFCVSSRLTGTKVSGNVLKYESAEYPTVESLIDVKGDVPNYDDFLQYELTTGCDVKVIYETDGYACSNQLDSEGNVTYTKSDSNTTADAVSCEKKQTSIFVDQSNNLPTDGVKHVLKSYSDGTSVLNNDFRLDTYRNTIYEIEFTNYTNIPDGAIKWDVSEAQDESIIAWLESISDGSKLNKLYVGSTGNIFANTDSAYLFSDMTSLTKISFGNFYTTDATSMYSMFYGDTSLSDLNVTGFETKNVTNFSLMFYNDVLLPSINVTSFDTTNVTNLSWMFASDNGTPMVLEEITGIERFNLSNATDISGMFYNDASIKSLNLSKWNTSNVTDMSYMFYNNYKNPSSLTEIKGIEKLNTSKVTSMVRMFVWLSNIKSLDLSKWDTSSVTDMNAMFACMESLTELNISTWNTSNVTNMFFMFEDLKSLISLDLSSFNTSKVTDMYGMFTYLENLSTLDLSNFDTSSVIDMGAMFAESSGIKSLNVSSFNTSKVTDMNSMFHGTTGLTSLDVSNFDTSKVTDMGYMFSGCPTFVDDKWINFNSVKVITGIENLNTSKVTNMNYMFMGNSGLSSLDLSNWNVSNVKTMIGMFEATKGLSTINLSNWNTSKLTSMKWMFGSIFGSNTGSILSQFTEIKGLADLNTSNVTDMSYTFYRCGSLSVVDLSGWDTSKVKNTDYMFRSFPNLTTIYVGDKWNMDNVTSSNTMFAYSRKLVGAVSYDESKTDKSMANTETGYLTYKAYTK